MTALGTATTPEEARFLEAAGVHGVVAQGAEAGGHRGTFLCDFEESMIPLAELVPSIDVSVPVVAAGGIVGAADVNAALELGAQGVQIGTAFLFTPECAVPREHLDALRTYDTVAAVSATARRRRRSGAALYGGTGAKRARELPVAELVQSLVR
jgi:NAD(P)H-dependent flavin oxidoreductase YrpB (nitropropane dioxygenase family)